MFWLAGHVHQEPDPTVLPYEEQMTLHAVDAIKLRFERLALRLNELDANLSGPQVAANLNRYRALLREQSEVADVVAKGATKASIRTREGKQVDLRVVERASFGAQAWPRDHVVSGPAPCSVPLLRTVPSSRLYRTTW